MWHVSEASAILPLRQNIAASAINVSELMDLPCFRPPGPVPMECDGPPKEVFANKLRTFLR